jgi:glycyl-tRNA synthetase
VLDHDTVGGESFYDALNVGSQRLAVGVVNRAGHGISDIDRVVTPIAVSENQGGTEIEMVGSGPGTVAQLKTAAHGVETDVRAGSGVAAARFLVHITKLSMSGSHATPDLPIINTMWSNLWRTVWKGPPIAAATLLHLFSPAFAAPVDFLATRILMADTTLMDKLVSLSKRRGFIFQSSEIYGGLGSVWDYGPLGVELKKNVKDRWWHAMVRARDDIEGLDAAILMHPKVWEASGHVAGFTDPLVDCRHCKNRFRADDPRIKGTAGQPDAQCPVCGSKGTLTEPRLFNLMFKTFMGPVENQAAIVYLRPETAQGIYVNYLNVLNSSRQKVPFGIAQIGKAFRNEITPGNFIFRTREFEQMEMQFFVKPGTDVEWFERWRAWRMEWCQELGLTAAKLRFHQHGPDELAHYAKAAFDIQYEFPFGWQEIEGVHNRTDFDLGRHQQYSGKRLEYFDQAANERYIPYIVETSAGADRVTLTVMVDAYREEAVEGETRVVLGFHPALAPIKAGVFPLVKKDGMPELATEVYHGLKRRFPVFYDDSGAIGRRYRRMDEAGTPFCVTIDGETVANRTVTVRHRDSMAQDRVGLDQLEAYLHERLTA